MTSEPFASTGEAFTTAFRLSPPLPELEYSALGNRLRQGLLDRLNSTSAPSVVINELYLAHSRCAGHALKLLRVWRQAPRISRVIRQTLRETFQVEPDGLLVNVSPSSGAGKHGNGLTETFMKLLAERECVKRGLLSEQACASGCLADEVLNKALDVDLLERIKAAASAYWQVLAEEAVCTRQAHWCDLYKQFVTDRAVLAHGFGQLSDEGLAMVLALVETPTPESRKQAAGRWARLHVSEVVCLGQNQAAIPIRGALHVHHGALPTAQRHVVFLPATSQMFYEFDTLEQWQTRFPALVNARARALWAMLPLERRHELPDATSHTLLPFTAEHPGPLITADPLEQSATSLLQVQWDNELATLLETNIAFLFPGNAIKGDYMSPTERLLHVEQWRQVLRVPRKWRRTFSGLLEWDKRRRHLEISFASLSKQLPLQQRELKVRLQTRAILSLSESENLSQESPAYKTFLAFHQQWLQASAACSALLDGQAHRLDDPQFWAQTDSAGKTLETRFLAARGSALLYEAQMQFQLKHIDKKMLQRVAAIVDNSSQANSGGDSLILGISIGGEVYPRYPLRAAFVVASDEALTQREVRRAVLFYAPGIEGGLQKFKSLAALTSSLQASVRAREPGGIWQCIGRGERNAARAWARGLKPDAMIKVVFDVIQGDVMSVGLKAQIQGLTDARQRVAGNERIFTEVADRVMGETLLGIEAAQGMQVPLNQARVLAMSNVQILISAAGYAAAQAGWYAGVSPVVSTRHQRMRLYQQRSELNLQRGLFTRMGALEPFVRELLTRQLSADGFTTLDIDAPLFDIPDDVNRVWASHPERPTGESGPKTVVSDERTTFSFLQLALHNLDPAAPWTRLRLANMKYLDSRWKARLSVDYLIQTISTLDVGGQYDRRILEAFYAEQHKEPDPLLRELVRRPVRRQAKMDLFSAKHQKTLSGEGQKLFSQALAGTPASSAKQSEQSFQIAFLRLEALTLPWARHVGGQMVIFDRQSGRCLLYWPGQSEGPSITEYTSRQALLNEQMQRGQSSTYIAQLAQAIAPGSETQAIASYPEGFTPQVDPISRWRSVLENLYVFSVFDPSSHITVMGAHLYKWFKTKRVFPAVALNEVESEIREQQEVGPHNWLAVTETDSRDMVGGLVHGRVQQQQRKARAECNSQADLAAYREWREGEAQDRRLRGLLSFVPGLGLGVAIYEVLSAARRFYHYGGWENGLELAFTIHMLIVEIAMTIVPAKLKVAVAKPFARSAGHGMNTALKQLQRGQRDLHWTPSHSPVPSKGLEGYKLSGPGENAVALKGPFNHGSYVKNGEQFVRDSKGARFGIYQREGEQHLRFKNPQTPGENELILHVREPRQWLLGADAPEPQPGPSSRVTQAWNVPPPARSPVGWVAPLVDPSEGVMRTPRNISSNWHRWAVVPESDRMVPIAPGSKLYRVDGRARQYLRVGQNYYETLPDGAQSSPNVVFIRPQEGFYMHRVEGTVLQLGVEGVEQPVPFTFGEDLRWTARQPLFNQPLSESIRSSFADMTPTSAQQVANRLVEMADTSGSSLTTTRLLTIRSTLDSWRTTGAGTMAQTDDLLRMLRPVYPRQKANIYIGIDETSSGFERLDFYLPRPLDINLSAPIKSGKALTNARAAASAEAVRHILLRQGFKVSVYPAPLSPGLSYLICTHPASDKLYFIWPKWLDSKSMDMRVGRGRMMSRAWFEDKSKLRSQSFTDVMKAMDEGRLVTAFAGIQNVDSPTVYFFRPADLSPLSR